MTPPRASLRNITVSCTLALTALMMCSCGLSRPSGYKGYQTRSYTVRGQTYHPMSVEAALDFEETGTCSW